MKEQSTLVVWVCDDQNRFIGQEADINVCYCVKVNRPEENGSQAVDLEAAENGEVTADSDKCKVPKDIFDFYEKMDRDEDDETELQTVSFEINQNSLEKLQKRSVTSVNSDQNYHSLIASACYLNR